MYWRTHLSFSLWGTTGHLHLPNLAHLLIVTKHPVTFRKLTRPSKTAYAKFAIAYASPHSIFATKKQKCCKYDKSYCGLFNKNWRKR